jgi:hypothetical protein
MMSDDPVCDHCGVGGPTFTAADLEAAFRVGLAMATDQIAGRSEYLSDALKWGGSKAYITSIKGGIIEFGNVGQIIRDLEPPTDLVDRVRGARK